MYDRIQCAFEVKTDDVQADGTFKGYGAVFGNVDLGRDIVMKGAFKDSIESKQSVKMLWQHDQRNPIGVYTSLKEDDHGLFVEGKIVLDVQQGKEAHALMKAGALDGLSIGFQPVTWKYDEEKRIRTLESVKLWEISPVTFPMNTEARVTGVKTVRDFERLLRDAGFSRSEVQTILHKGYKALEGAREAADDDLIAAIKRNTSILTGARQ